MTATTGYNKLSGVYEALEKAMLAANPDDEGSCEINPQTPEQHWASGASCIASKSSVCGEHDREQLTWFGHVLLICRPKVSDAGAGPSIGGQQGITSADLHSLYNLQPQEVSGQAQRGLKKVSFSNFGLQLLSISASPEDSAAGGEQHPGLNAVCWKSCGGAHTPDHMKIWPYDLRTSFNRDLQFQVHRSVFVGDRDTGGASLQLPACCIYEGQQHP